MKEIKIPSPEEKQQVTVIGAGSWGTALAHHLGKQGHQVRLWVYEPELLKILQEQQENTMFLPKVKLSQNLSFSGQVQEAAKGADVIVMAVPSHVFRQVLSSLSSTDLSECIIVGATKGIENDTLLTMEGVVREVLGPECPYAILSGPSFAAEVAQGQPTVVTVASRQRAGSQSPSSSFFLPPPFGSIPRLMSPAWNWEVL